MVNGTCLQEILNNIPWRKRRVRYTLESDMLWLEAICIRVSLNLPPCGGSSSVEDELFSLDYPDFLKEQNSWDYLEISKEQSVVFNINYYSL